MEKFYSSKAVLKMAGTLLKMAGASPTSPPGTAPGRHSKIVSICVDLCGVCNNKLRNLRGPRLEKS